MLFRSARVLWQVRKGSWECLSCGAQESLGQDVHEPGGVRGVEYLRVSGRKSSLMSQLVVRGALLPLSPKIFRRHDFGFGGPCVDITSPTTTDASSSG